MLTKHTGHGIHADHPKEKSIFSCSNCSEKFSSLADLSAHRKAEHDTLEKMKEEIIQEIDHEFDKHDKKRISWGNGLVTIVLIVLTLVSIVQTVQSVIIFKKINSGDFKSPSGSSPALPASVDNLPNMVGGC